VQANRDTNTKYHKIKERTGENDATLTGTGSIKVQGESFERYTQAAHSFPKNAATIKWYQVYTQIFIRHLRRP